MRIVLMFAASLCAMAQSGLNAPTLGWMLDAQDNLRAALGIAGSAMAGDVVRGAVRSFACSAQVCAAKSDSGISLGSQSAPAPAGDARIALTPAGAFFYFPSTGHFASWNGGTLEALSFNARELGGEVLSIFAAQAGSLDVAVRRKDGAAAIERIDLDRGTRRTIDSIPGESGPVILMKSGFLYASENAAILRRPDASEVRFPIAGATKFFAMNEQWVEAVTRDAHWAIRITPGHEQAMLLPEISR